MTSLLPWNTPPYVIEVLAHKDALGQGRDFDRGRYLASKVLAGFGHAKTIIPRLPQGAPHWPYGIIGSLSHSNDWYICGAAKTENIKAYGLDIEPLRAAKTMVQGASTYLNPQEITVCTQQSFLTPSEVFTLAFSAKETAMKALSDPNAPILTFERFQLASVSNTHIDLFADPSTDHVIPTPQTISVEWGRIADHVVTRFFWQAR